MRIAVISNVFPPLAQGGAGQIAKLQTDWLINHGHQVSIFTVAPFPEEQSGGLVSAFASHNATSFRDLNKKSAWHRFWFHLDDLSANLSAVEAVKNWEPDILLTHNLTGCGWSTPSILKDIGLRWIHILHDVQLFEPSGQIIFKESCPGLRNLWRGFWARLRLRALGDPDIVISPSDWLISEHKKFGFFKNIKAVKIPNPILLTENTNKKTFKTLKDSESPAVVYLGRLAKDKGVEVLIQAWQKLNPRPGRLELIGDGPLFDYCKNLSDPSITVLGQLAHEQALERLSNSNLLILPSLVMENQPTVILEAVQAGANVIAADVGGVRELLGGYGVVIQPGNANLLAEAIKEQIDQKPNQSAAQKIIGQHSVDKVMPSLVNIMQQLCSS